MASNTQIIDLVNEVMKRIPGLGIKDSLWMQDFLDKGVKNLIKNKSIGRESLSEFLFQKKPPHNISTETSFIGKVLLFPSKTMPTCNGITPEYFYDIRHSWIWTSIMFLWDEGKKVTVDGILSNLTANDKIDIAGGKRYVEALIKDQSTIEDLPDRIEELTAYYMLRGVWKQCAEAVHDCYSTLPEDANTFRHKVIESLGQYTANNIKTYQDGASLADKLKKSREKQKEAILRGDGITGHRSPVSDLDAVTNGWQDTDVVVIAGRPGMGKTALAITDVAIALQMGEPVVFFSLEMSATQLVTRLFAIMKGYKMEDLLKGDEIATLATKAFDKFVEEELPYLPLYIDDKPGVNWKYVQDKSLYFKNKYGIKRIYIDYLQLMSGIDPRVSNVENIISENSRGLKIVAKSCDCPVFVLSQLSRQCEQRADKRPNLSDLRSSGAIEQDADIVIFCYRNEYYKIFEDDDGQPTDGVAELIIAKHRAGSLETVKAFFNAPLTKWNNLHAKPMGYTSGANQKAKEDSDWDFDHLEKSIDTPF